MTIDSFHFPFLLHSDRINLLKFDCFSTFIDFSDRHRSVPEESQFLAGLGLGIYGPKVVNDFVDHRYINDFLSFITASILLMLSSSLKVFCKLKYLI